MSVADGVITFDDISSYLDQLEAMGVLPYQKIFVTHSGALELSQTDLSRLAERLAVLNEAGPLGPFAIVAAPARSMEFMRFFTALAGVKRKLRVFRTIHDARRWLKQQRERLTGRTTVAIRVLPLR